MSVKLCKHGGGQLFNNFTVPFTQVPLDKGGAKSNLIISCIRGGANG